MAQVFLGNIMVVQPAVPGERLAKLLGGGESGLGDDLLDPAVEPLHHSIGLGTAWAD